MKPIIGIMPLWDDEKDSIWMLPGYMDGLSLAGATPVIFPFSRDADELAGLVKLCDGILFTGGHDVSPEIYREKPAAGRVCCCEKRDKMEEIVLRAAMEMDRPILGICRGIQFINAALGGSLYQDLPSQHPSELKHRQSAPYDFPIHDVELVENTPLYRLLGVKRLPVNSCHHQALKDLAPGLQVMAVAADGLVEAICMPAKRFLWAVQWHPEFSYKTDANSRKIFEAFVDSAKRRGKAYEGKGE